METLKSVFAFLQNLLLTILALVVIKSITPMSKAFEILESIELEDIVHLVHFCCEHLLKK